MFDFNNYIPEPHYFVNRRATPNWCIKPSVIPFHDLTYVINGKAIYSIGTQKILVQEGDLLYIPYNTFRSAVQFEDAPIECHSFNFFLYDSKGNPVSLDLPIHNHIGKHSNLLDICYKTNEIWSHKEFGFELQTRGYLCILISTVLNILFNPAYVNISTDIRIQNAIKYIKEHYAECIHINDVANVCHLCPTYFGKLFQKTTGLSFKQYLTHIRLNYAETMLKTGEYSVNETALQCGFSDVFYFSKIFKKHKGVNPSSVSKYSE